MIGKKARKGIMKIQKEIDRLKEGIKKIELRPCHGDADLKQKDEELVMLRREIYELEKEANLFSIYISGIGSGP